MATLVPPPSKRQKLDSQAKAEAIFQANQIPTDLGSIRIQFAESSSGSTLPTISIAVADATVKNLEQLLNTLRTDESGEKVPYRFFFNTGPKRAVPGVDSKDEEERDGILDVERDVYSSILKPGLKTVEDTITLHYAPQAVFRVRPVSRCSASISGHGEPILCAQFSPSSSSILATGSGDNTARLWDTDTGTPLHTLKGHTSWVLVVSFSPDGNLLATGSMDNTIRLWDPKSGSPLGTPMKGHTKWVTSLAWEPYHALSQGKPRLASASKDGTVRIWDVPLRRIEQCLSGHRSSVTCVRWGGLNRLYTASQDKTIKLWNTKTWSCLHTLTSHAHWVNHLALSTDFVLRTGYLDTHSAPGSVKLPSDASTSQKQAHARSRFESAARVNGKVSERLISASDDNTIFLWAASDFDPDAKATPKPLARLLGHQKQVNHVSFSPDGHYIASCSFDNSVKLWNATTGEFLCTMRGHVGAVYMACWSADSRLLVSASKDTTIKVWDVVRSVGEKKGVLREDLPGHRDEVFTVDWSADGRCVGSGGRDRVVKVWKN